MVPTGLVLPMRLNHTCSKFWKNQICQSVLHSILTSAASFPVGKTKPNKKLKLWINPHVHAKIRNRDRLRHTIHQNQQEWIEACPEPNGTINEAKANSWKDLPHRSISNVNDLDMWKVIGGLNCILDTNLTQ